jgi:hypothetical protein
MSYTPRRARLSRWLQDAPDYILDCFDDKGPGDRYTVFFGKDMMNTYTDAAPWYANVEIAYLGMNDVPTHPSHGISQWGSLNADQTARYRYANGKKRVRWLDIPENVRSHVIARATSED